MSSRETLEVDFLFVGAGPASLSSAITLKKAVIAFNEKAENPIDEPMIVVIEKASEIGGHQVSGAVIDPSPLHELFPDFLARNCPMESNVTQEAVYYLTKGGQFKFPLLPPQFKNHGNYVASLSKFTAWLGEQAVELGIEVFPGFTGVEVLYEGDRVIGVRTGDKGIDAKGNPKANFEQGMDILAKCTVFGEGVRGYLTKQIIPRLGLTGTHPQTFETAVKEVWQCKKGTIKPGMVIHTMGYPLDSKTVGGSFIYGMKDDLLVIGLVVSLDYKDPLLEPYLELQKLKNHPLISNMIEGGQQVAYGAKAISAGGYYAMPQLVFNGGLIVGEAGQLIDIAKLKGIHVGMRSGIEAGKVLFDLLKNQKDFTFENLKKYPENFLQSVEGKDLFKARNFHQALAKGMPAALFHIGAQMITQGRGFTDPMPVKHIDRETFKTVQDYYGESPVTPQLPMKTPFTLDKLSSVFNSGTIHEEDQVSHLKVPDSSKCNTCFETFQSPCTRFCPAGVYETVQENNSKRLQINFTNCVHCQTCDINCPKDNILWTPPESGGGPNYKLL